MVGARLLALVSGGSQLPDQPLRGPRVSRTHAESAVKRACLLQGVQGFPAFSPRTQDAGDPPQVVGPTQRVADLCVEREGLPESPQRFAIPPQTDIDLPQAT